MLWWTHRHLYARWRGGPAEQVIGGFPVHRKYRNKDTTPESWHQTIEASVLKVPRTDLDIIPRMPRRVYFLFNNYCSMSECSFRRLGMESKNGLKFDIWNLDLRWQLSRECCWQRYAASIPRVSTLESGIWVRFCFRRIKTEQINREWRVSCDIGSNESFRI